jgi:hypothetical protein
MLKFFLNHCRWIPYPSQFAPRLPWISLERQILDRYCQDTGRKKYARMSNFFTVRTEYVYFLCIMPTLSPLLEPSYKCSVALSYAVYSSNLGFSYCAIFFICTVFKMMPQCSFRKALSRIRLRLPTFSFRKVSKSLAMHKFLPDYRPSLVRRRKGNCTLYAKWWTGNNSINFSCLEESVRLVLKWVSFNNHRRRIARVRFLICEKMWPLGENVTPRVDVDP